VIAKLNVLTMPETFAELRSGSATYPGIGSC